MRMQTKKIGPQQAKELLKKLAPNRRCRPSLVRRYAADMRAGRWKLTHEGIAIDEKSYVIDGQHRLWAIEDSGATIETRVFIDGDRKTISAVNIGGARTAADQMTIGGMGTPQRNRLAAATAKAMLAGLRYRGCDISVDATIRCVQKYEADIDWALGLIASRVKRAPVLAVIVKGAIINGQDRVEPFCIAIRDNVFPGPRDPANMLARWLLNLKRAKSYGDVYGRTAYALRAFLTGRQLRSSLQSSSTDIGLEDLLDEFVPPISHNDKAGH